MPKDDRFIVEEDSVALVPTKKTVGNAPTEGTSLVDLFDRYQKKIYLFDESGSMHSGMAPEDEQAMYDWTPDWIKKTRQQLFDAEVAGIVMEDPALDRAEAEAEASEALGELMTNDQALIKHVIDHHLLHSGKIAEPPRNYNNPVQTESKIAAVRGAMAKFVEQRFEKFPDAQVAVFGFGGSTHLKCYAGAKKEEVMLAIQALSACDSSTDITQAVRRGVNECKRRPSQVGAHHIVLVSDGIDYKAKQVKELLPEMKDRNIVFDFIFVKGQYDGGFYGSADPEMIKVLREVCEATGGEYNEVNKSSDFEKKFLAVSNRRALPPAR